LPQEFINTLSFTPGFSPVGDRAGIIGNRFNGFNASPNSSAHRHIRRGQKENKTVKNGSACFAKRWTGLKPGLNETSFEGKPVACSIRKGRSPDSLSS
jgi:hypothetical protein